MKKRISIGTWAYAIGPYADKPVPFDTVMAKLKELGFDGIELGGFPPHPNPDDLADKASRETIKQKMADNGLAFSGLAANLWMHKIISVEDHGPYLAEVDKNLQFAEDLGIGTVRVDTLEPVEVFETTDYKVGRDRVVKVFREAAKRAADKGLRIAWEFEPGFAFNKPSEVLGIVKEVDAPNFGLMYDTCHANMCAKVGARQYGEKETLPGGALEMLQMLKPYINHVHLIDSDDTLHHDETSTHPPFGDGNLDFDVLGKELATVPLPHDWWVIDLCFWPDAWDATEKCKRYLDKLLPTL